LDLELCGALPNTPLICIHTMRPCYSNIYTNSSPQLIFLGSSWFRILITEMESFHARAGKAHFGGKILLRSWTSLRTFPQCLLEMDQQYSFGRTNGEIWSLLRLILSSSNLQKSLTSLSLRQHPPWTLRLISISHSQYRRMINSHYFRAKWKACICQQNLTLGCTPGDQPSSPHPRPTKL
jgi:hypothetical protein